MNGIKTCAVLILFISGLPYALASHGIYALGYQGNPYRHIALYHCPPLLGVEVDYACVDICIDYHHTLLECKKACS